MTKQKDSKPTRARECAENVKITEATVSLAEFVENPDNPSVATDEDIARLAGKLKRVPLGLTAMRIAYVTDADGDERTRGKKMVISGNKRLRVLKQAYGENGEVPAEWFADVTAMSEAERHEFIVTANVSDGEFLVDKLLADYGKDELADFMKPQELEKLLADIGETKEQNLAENEELDADAFEDVIEFKVSLSSEQYDAVVSRLRSVNEDLAVALVEVCRG